MHKYPFSWKVAFFSQHVLKFEHNHTLVGVVVVNFRDGIAKVPYFFVLPGSEKTVAKALLLWLLVSRFMGCLPGTAPPQRMESMKIPAVFKRKVFKRMDITCIIGVLEDTFELQMVMVMPFLHNAVW